jgi:glutathione peroxidase-family protein
MLKTFVLNVFIFSLCQYAFATNDLYGISFMGLDSSQIKLKDYAGKQIIVVEFDAANPNIKLLMSLDSLYRNSNGNVVIIGIPINDFAVSPLMSSSALLLFLRDSLKITYPLAYISNGKNGVSQHPLIQWVTSTSPKNHFNISLEKPGELFVISSNGILYAVLKEGMPSDDKVMKYILNNQARE